MRKDKRSHQVEKDFEFERKKWLGALGEIDFKLRGFEEITV